MFKKLLAFTCFLVASMNVRADVLRKDDVARFQALSGLSQGEAQEFVNEARGYVSKLHEMSYSSEEVDTVVNQQLNASLQKQGAVQDNSLNRRTVLVLLAMTVVSSIAAVAGAVGGRYLYLKLKDRHTEDCLDIGCNFGNRLCQNAPWYL